MRKMTKILLISALVCFGLFVNPSGFGHTMGTLLVRAALQGDTAVGSFGGVPMAIPREYLNFGVHYVGENIWKPSATLLLPNQQTPIENISLLLRLSTLEPIRTEQDQSDWIQAMSRKMEGWIRISLQKSSGDYTDEHDWLRQSMARTGAIFDPNHQRYEAAEPAHGLQHFKLVRNINLSIPRDTIHTYWDFDGMTDLIWCDEPVTPEGHDYVQCQQIFYLPQFKAYAQVFYPLEHLAEWRHIHSAVVKQVNSFIVPLNADVAVARPSGVVH